MIVCQLIKLMTLRQSKTTQDLLSQIERFKSQKQTIVGKLTQGISKNKDIIEESLFLRNKDNDKTMMKRFRSIDILEKKLNCRKQTDSLQDARLESDATKNQKRKAELERRLQELAKRNLNRLHQLKIIEENVLAKINGDIKKNEVRERHLKQEYERLKKQQNVIKDVNSHQKNQAKMQWRVIQSQKWKLESQMRQKASKHQQLIIDKNPKPIKREDRKKETERYIPNEKQYNRLKNPAKVDHKEAGRQYLEQAKMVHREAVADRKKKKMLNLNLKVINYNRDIMQRIFRNTSDLSKQPKPLVNSQRISFKDEKQTEKQLFEIDAISQSSLSFRKGYEIKEDLETQRYLLSVKNNIQELEKINKMRNPQQDVHSMVSDKMLLPITIQSAEERF